MLASTDRVCLKSQRARAALVLGNGLLLVLMGAAGYWQLFSSFARYDDEGYVHLSLRSYLAGHPLYDEVCTQYGPAFFVLEGMLHRATGVPVTHDVARFKTLALWLLTAALAAGVVQRLTARTPLAALAFAGTFLHLDRLGLEPGHPQELVLPLLVGTLWLGATPPATARKDSLSRAIGLGLLTGTLGLIKANLGVLTGLGCGLAMVLSLPRSRASGLLGTALLVAVAALPFVLARGHAWSVAGIALPAAVVVGALGLALQAGGLSTDRAPDDGHCRGGDASWRELRTFVLATGTTAALFGLTPLCQGTSTTGLWYGLVGQHRGFLDLFYHHPPLPDWSLAWTAGALIAAVLVRRHPRAALWLRWLSPALLLVIGLTWLEETWRPIDHGLSDRGGAGLLAGCLPPLAWLLLITPSRTIGALTQSASLARPACDFARRLLATATLLQPLGMYPTPGTQTAIGTLPAFLMLVVGLADLCTTLELADCGRAAGWPGSHAGIDSERHIGWSLLRPGVAALGALLAMTLAARAGVEAVRYHAREPLGLPGARLLRLPAEDVATLRRTVAWLQSHADVFVATPTGCCSLYLWSELPPPTTFNTTFWEVLLSDPQQRAVIDVLNRARSPRLVIDRRQHPVIHRDAPLQRYLEQRFVVRETTGDLEVWAAAPPELAARP